MKQILTILMALALALSVRGQSELINVQTPSGKTVRFILHLPKSYDSSRSYPVAVGPSELESKRGSYYWKDFRSNDSWILIDAEIYKGIKQAETLKAIRKYLQENHSIEGNKFHAVCFSANSSPIFKLVMAAPDLFHSITGMPASVSASDSDFQQLKDVKIQLLVGEDDGYWLRSSKSLHQKFQRLGLDSRIEIFPNIGHFLLLVRGKPLMDRLDKFRPKM